MPSSMLPIRETAQLASTKLPIRETVWLLIGFIITERVIGWKELEFTLIENVRSKLSAEVSLVDKNNVKISWIGDPVAKVEIYKRIPGYDWESKPVAVVPWSPNEYILNIDSNAYEIKLNGINDTGEADVVTVGEEQEYALDVKYTLPINEKYYFFDVDLTKEYRFEVDM